MFKLNFQKRETVIVVGGAALIVLMLIFTFAQRPWRAYKASIANVAQAEESLRTARITRDAVLAARAGMTEIRQRARARQAGYDLYQHLANAVRQVALESRSDIQSRPSPSRDAKYATVQLSIKGASLQELIDLLHAIHAGDPLVILESMNYLKPDRESKGLDCQMTFITPKAGAA